MLPFPTMAAALATARRAGIGNSVKTVYIALIKSSLTRSTWDIEIEVSGGEVVTVAGSLRPLKRVREFADNFDKALTAARVRVCKTREEWDHFLEEN